MKRSCPRSGTVFTHVSSDVVVSVVVVVAAVVGLGLRLSDCNHAQLDYRGGYRGAYQGQQQFVWVGYHSMEHTNRRA